jgi:redox-sensitive bicupin YhaK (pirin superfamily)
MIAVCRAAQRHHWRRGRQDTWETQIAGDQGGTGVVRHLGETRVPPGAPVRQTTAVTVDVLTCVHEGSLTFKGANGSIHVVAAGEFYLAAAGTGPVDQGSNTSTRHWAHLFQVFLRSATPSTRDVPQQKRFGAAIRRGAWCLVASPDAREGSLALHHNVLVYAALLEQGQHVVHALNPGRCAWLHQMCGEVSFAGDVLAAGDGAGVCGERAVAVTARTPAELLLLDVAGAGW